MSISLSFTSDLLQNEIECNAFGYGDIELPNELTVCMRC